MAAVMRVMMGLVVRPAGASEGQTRKGWSYQVGFLEEAAVRIWMGVGTRRSRWKGMG